MTIQFTNTEARQAFHEAEHSLAGLQRVRFVESVQRVSDSREGGKVSAEDIQSVLSSEGFARRPEIIIKKNHNGKEE